ncbi:MAG: 2-succinyl-5-enolpyruvyl-6-hydroxy-3-cyclohexene-1-carboxylic-acid synthase [Opitutales bacterium]
MTFELPALSRRNVNFAWGGVLAEALWRAGVELAVICPGSRSAPLATGFALQGRVEALPCLDERSAGFFALGHARRTGKPVALVCTSGTAAANWLPAVVEAHYSQLPLLLITADRPPELRDCSAGQSIDQIKLFGAYVRWYHELALPQSGLLQYLVATARQAVGHCLRQQAGPVHLNAPFREPLSPVAEKGFSVPANVEGALACIEPVTTPPARPLDTKAVDILRRWLSSASFGCILAGEAEGVETGPAARAAGVIALAEQTGLPLFADVLHPVRHHSAAGACLGSYEQLLRSPAFPALGFAVVDGRLPTSKTLRQRLAADRTQLFFLTDSQTNLNPTHGPTIIVGGGAGALADVMETDSGSRPDRHEQLRPLVDRLAAQALELARDGRLTEMAVMRLLGVHLPPRTPVMLASSTPIRDGEWFWPVSDRRYWVLANRGANGIDGTLSSALGVAHRAGQPTVLVTGDLAFLHDANGLLLARELSGSLTVVLIDNHGGGIFQNLPVSAHEPPFERFFATPQQVDWFALAAAHDVEARAVESASMLAEAVGCLPESGLRLLVARTDRREAAAERIALLDALAEPTPE